MIDNEKRRKVASRLRDLIDDLFTDINWTTLKQAVFGDANGRMRADVVGMLADLIDPGADTTVSAYDLLPDADRAVLDWVAGRGGLDGIRKRLMPEGMEWPRFEDGEPVRVGDEFADGRGNTRRCLSVELTHVTDDMYNALVYWSDDPCEYLLVCMWQGESVQRPAPKVLDADGVEIVVGDDLYSVEGGLKFHVGCIDTRNGKIATAMMFAIDKWADPSLFTHRAPVLAADGKPLREGETVYDIEDRHAYPHTVVNTELDGFEHVKTTCERPNPASISIHPSRLTHEHPVEDTWERLEEDARNIRTAMPDSDKLPFEVIDERALDLVRRARALAERGL